MPGIHVITLYITTMEDTEAENCNRGLNSLAEPNSSFTANLDGSGQGLVGGSQLGVMFQSNIVVLLLLVPELGDCL